MVSTVLGTDNRMEQNIKTPNFLAFKGKRYFGRKKALNPVAFVQIIL